MTDTPDILTRIVATKRYEVERAKGSAPLDDWRDELDRLPPVRDFAAALRGEGEVRVIAEIKKASPSKGIIRADFDPVAIARAYQAGGAACLSVLTDREYFKGDLEYLRQVRGAVDLPLLRKDFTIDPYQIYEARRYGADAILLIAAILTDGEMAEFLELAASLGLAALVEVHTAEELERVKKTPATLIGVNNRNLSTFETTLQTTFDLLPAMPKGAVKVSESGIFGHEEVTKLGAAGINAVLVGESLMRQDDVEQALLALRGR